MAEVGLLSFARIAIVRRSRSILTAANEAETADKVGCLDSQRKTLRSENSAATFGRTGPKLKEYWSAKERSREYVDSRDYA